MGVAYWIEFDRDDLETDFTDGKSIARAMDDLNALAQELDITPLEAFMGTSLEDLSDLLGEEIELDDDEPMPTPWFEPAEGLAVIEALIAAVQAHPDRVPAPEDVLSDLHGHAEALRTAAAHGAKWHLAIDF